MKSLFNHSNQYHSRCFVTLFSHITFSLISILQGDELVQELQKVDRLADQRVALDLLQQLINGILSAYTLAR